MLGIILTKNLDIVFLIYGLSFFVLGLTIFLQPPHKSVFKLIHILWLLGLFGLIHGINEWLDMITLIKAHDSYIWNLARTVVLTISFIFLFEFGRRLFNLNFNKEFLGSWVTPAISLAVFTIIFTLKQERSIWPRYFLCFPGGLLTAQGFLLYYRRNKIALEPFKVRKYFFISAASIGMYGVFSGLLVSRADFFPASVINNASFLNLFGIPVQVFRALCATILAWTCWHILEIFNQEHFHKIKADLDELVATKEKLIQSESLAALGRISTIISHEFKNELCVMQNSVYYLEMRLENSDEKVKKQIKILTEEIAETARIIDNIAGFAKNKTLVFKPVNLESLLAAAIKKIKIPKTIKVEIKIEKNLPLIQADQIQLARVFNNIILNSLQAMEETGSLEIEASGLHDFINILFKDSGTGIKETDRKNIFDPFFSTKNKGMGLGLVTSKMIIEAHQGRIDIANQVNKGVVVTIQLPVKERENA